MSEHLISREAAEAFHQSHPSERFRCALCDEMTPETPPARQPLWSPRRWLGLCMPPSIHFPDAPPRGVPYV